MVHSLHSHHKVMMLYNHHFIKVMANSVLKTHTLLKIDMCIEPLS